MGGPGKEIARSSQTFKKPHNPTRSLSMRNKSTQDYKKFPPAHSLTRPRTSLTLRAVQEHHSELQSSIVQKIYEYQPLFKLQ